MTQERIRVLIVDDSALVRQTLSQVLSTDPAIEVIATASDPFVAAERISEQMPDVITLDIEMPRMDGLTFLRKIMAQHPIPVVVCSSLAEEGAQTTLKALEYGAVEIIAKPRLGSKQFLEESRVLLCQAVRAAAAARLRATAPSHVVEPKLTADAILTRGTSAMLETTEKVVVIGASTEEPRRSGRCSKPCPSMRPASSSCSICRKCSPAPSRRGWTAFAGSP